MNNTYLTCALCASPATHWYTYGRYIQMWRCNDCKPTNPDLNEVTYESLLEAEVAMIKEKL